MLLTLFSCASKKTGIIDPSDTTAPAENTPPATTESTPPPTTEAPPPLPEDERTLLIRELSGCGYPHERVFRNPIVDPYRNDFENLKEITELPSNVDTVLLNELVILKLSDVYQKQYPNSTITSAQIRFLETATYSGIDYLLISGILFSLDTAEGFKSTDNLILLVPFSLIEAQN
jgi:hypothetical protein